MIINTFWFFISLAKSSVMHSLDAPISMLAVSAIKKNLLFRITSAKVHVIYNNDIRNKIKTWDNFYNKNKTQIQHLILCSYLRIKLHQQSYGSLPYNIKMFSRQCNEQDVGNGYIHFKIFEQPTPVVKTVKSHSSKRCAV